MTTNFNKDNKELLATVEQWIDYRMKDVEIKDLQSNDIQIIIDYVQASEQMRFNDLLEGDSV